jgi:glutathione S-transferase
MLKLRFSPASPFARKVRIAAATLDLADRIELVAADTNNPQDTLRIENPLGKIPILVLEDGTTIYDSRIIEQYLDWLGGGRLLPAAGLERFKALTAQSLADGMIDAAILLVYETRFREPAERSEKWRAYQSDKIARALAHWEVSPPPEGVADLVTISLACALGYLDLRHEGRWREGHPRLVKWLDAFSAAVPAFEETRFRG